MVYRWIWRSSCIRPVRRGRTYSGTLCYSFRRGENSFFGYRSIVFNEELRLIPWKPVKEVNARIILGNLGVFEMELTNPMWDFKTICRPTSHPSDWNILFLLPCGLIRRNETYTCLHLLIKRLALGEVVATTLELYLSFFFLPLLLPLETNIMCLSALTGYFPLFFFFLNLPPTCFWLMAAWTVTVTKHRLC